jgi:hypothetical protein
MPRRTFVAKMRAYGLHDELDYGGAANHRWQCCDDPASNHSPPGAPSIPRRIRVRREITARSMRGCGVVHERRRRDGS